MSLASRPSDQKVKPESLSRNLRGRRSVAELGAIYRVEGAHTDQVAALALALFDATHRLVAAPADDRPLLDAACRLHDLGYGVDPRHHARIGQEIVLREGLAGFTPAQRRDIAAAIWLHSPQSRNRSAHSPAGRPLESLRALRLAAYLRIADGLDYCHLREATIVGVVPRDGGVRVRVRCGLFPSSVKIAARRSDLWRDVFSQDLRWVLVGGRSRRAAGLLTRGMGAREAVRRLLFVHYRTIVMNLEGALRYENDEALHEIRIAIRKARTVLRGFRKSIALASARRLDSDLRRLNRALGLARDLDVWIAFLTNGPVRLRLAGNRNWQKFTSHQQALRRLQQATVRRHLSGSAFTSLRTRFGRLLRIELPREIGRVPAVPIESLAGSVLAKQLRRAMRLAELRHARSPEKLHRLRIALRRVRYLSLCFRPVLGPAIDRLRNRTHAVERVLGDIRDTSLTLARIQHEGPTPPRLLMSQLKRSHQNALAKLDRVWPRLENPALLLRVRRALER